MRIPVGKVPELLDKLGMTEEEVKKMVEETLEIIEKVADGKEVKTSELILPEFPIDKAVAVLKAAGEDPDGFNSVFEAKVRALAVLYETFFGRSSG